MGHPYRGERGQDPHPFRGRKGWGIRTGEREDKNPTLFEDEKDDPVEVPLQATECIAGANQTQSVTWNPDMG